MMQARAAQRQRSPGRPPNDIHIRKPIEIPVAAEPTPKVLRAFRMQAGLTKGEAAHIVGLNGKSASWHQYELGRYAIPPDKWAIFAQVLRSGRYPAACFSATRRGPRVSEAFQVGRMLAPATERPTVDADGCARVRAARSALRLSASALAAELSIELHRIYRIESETASPTAVELAKVLALLESHLQLLREVDFSTADIRALREDVLRLSSTEAARLAGLKGSRPGTSWSALESGARVDEKATARFRKSGLGLMRKMESGLAGLINP